MPQLITPNKVEGAAVATGGIATLMSYLDLTEYLAIGTFIMGIFFGITGHIFKAREAKLKAEEANLKAEAARRKEIQDALDAQHRQLQIEREKLELEAMKADMSGFRFKKGVRNGN